MKNLNKFLCLVLLCLAFSTKSFSADVGLKFSLLLPFQIPAFGPSEILSVKVTYSNAIQTLEFGPYPLSNGAFSYSSAFGELGFNLASFGPSLFFAPSAFPTVVTFEIETCHFFAYEFPQTVITDDFTIPSTTVSGQPNPLILPDLFFDFPGGLGVENKPTFALRFSNESQNSFLNPILNGQDTVGFDFKFFANEGSVISGNFSGITPTSSDSSFGLEEAISLEGSFRTPNNTSIFQDSIFTFQADTTKVKFGNSTPWGNFYPVLYLDFENSVTALNLDSSKYIFLGAINYFPNLAICADSRRNSNLFFTNIRKLQQFAIEWQI